MRNTLDNRVWVFWAAIKKRSLYTFLQNQRPVATFYVGPKGIFSASSVCLATFWREHNKKLANKVASFRVADLQNMLQMTTEEELAVILTLEGELYLALPDSRQNVVLPSASGGLTDLTTSQNSGFSTVFEIESADKRFSEIAPYLQLPTEESLQTSDLTSDVDASLCSKEPTGPKPKHGDCGFPRSIGGVPKLLSHINIGESVATVAGSLEEAEMQIHNIHDAISRSRVLKSRNFEIERCRCEPVAPNGAKIPLDSDYSTYVVIITRPKQ